jgi:anti-sigma B factor antagonist
MQVNAVAYKHCDLVEVKGRVDSATAPDLAKSIESLTKNGHHKIVIDMNAVDFISSAGLRVLISTQKECRRYNRGEVVLAAVSPKVQSALDLAGFNTLFKIYKDVLSAVGSF